MRGKTMRILSGVAVVVAAIVCLTVFNMKDLNAAPTLSDVVLTNIAALNWTGGSTTNTNISSPVGTNYGATWIGENDKIITPGQYTSNITVLTNEGNAQSAFYFYAISNTTRTASLTWTNWYTNMTDGGARGSTLTINISPAGFKLINFEVFAPIGETNTAYITYNCAASNLTAQVNGGNPATYTGLNATVYGGNMGIFGGAANYPYTTLLSNFQANFTNWVVTVAAANMTIAKTVNISNAVPYQASTTVPYPGALISYKIAYENIGAATAANVRIIDTLPTNYVDMSTTAALFRREAFGDTFLNYFAAAGVAITLAVGDDDGSTNNLAGDQVVFCPTAGTAPLTGGSVNAAASGSYFFSVLLK